MAKTRKEIAKETDLVYKAYIKAVCFGASQDEVKELQNKYYRMEREYQKAVYEGR